MNNKFLKFEDARNYVRKLGLHSKREWKEYSKAQRPKFLPSNPNITYKKEWVSFQDWMGYDWLYRKIYSVNEDFFKKWSGDMAYVLGFWFADGYIYKNESQSGKQRYIFGISQCEKYILEDISKVMNSTYPIHEENRKRGAISYRFFIESESIIKDILLLGGNYRKSLIAKFPYVPSKYLPDFIRGLWDGDGSAFMGRRNSTNNGVASASFTCGSKSFIDDFATILKSNYNIQNPRIASDKRRKSAYNMVLQPNDARRLGKVIYTKSNLFLRRKRDKFKAMGEITLSPKDKSKRMLSYLDAKSIVRTMNFLNYRDFENWARSQKIYSNLPHEPQITYKNKGWENWYEFLGKTNKKGKAKDYDSN